MKRYLCNKNNKRNRLAKPIDLHHLKKINSLLELGLKLGLKPALKPGFKLSHTFKLGSASLGLFFSFSLFISLFVFCTSALALDFRSIAPTKAVLYDAPSTQAGKLYILNNGYPVEIIVDLGAWVKVRDVLGGLSWMESNQLSAKRTVLVLAPSAIYSNEDASSTVVASIEKDVTLTLVSSELKNGWVKVKHRDGLTGFMQANTLWGSN